MTDPPAYMLIIAAGGEDPMSRSLISAEEAQAIAAVLDHHRKGYGKTELEQWISEIEELLVWSRRIGNSLVRGHG